MPGGHLLSEDRKRGGLPHEVPGRPAPAQKKKNGPAKSRTTQKTACALPNYAVQCCQGELKGQDMGDGRPPCPYAGESTSHTAEFLRHAHYTGNPRVLQGEISDGSVCWIGLCRDYHTCTAFLLAPTGAAPGGRGSPPPGGFCWGPRGAVLRRRFQAFHPRPRGMPGGESGSGGYIKTARQETIRRAVFHRQQKK